MFLLLQLFPYLYTSGRQLADKIKITTKDLNNK